MNFLSDREVKEELKEMLSWLNAFLGEYEINYTIMSGTMLGAVRHGGFIPWDDDIDIGLLRNDYEKLIHIARDFEDSKYKFEGFEVEGFGRPFLKFINKEIAVEIDNEEDHHLWIDIFPFDGVPNHFSGIYQFYFHKVLRNIRNTKNEVTFEKGLANQSSKIKQLYNRLLRFITQKYSENDINRIIIRQAKERKIDKCDYIEDITWGNKKFPKRCMEKLIDYKFENITVKGMKDYDTYLKSIYGDYMKLPPVEKRVNHGIKSWRVEENEK